MRHVGQKLALCLIGPFCSFFGLLEVLFCLFTLCDIRGCIDDSSRSSILVCDRRRRNAHVDSHAVLFFPLHLSSMEHPIPVELARKNIARDVEKQRDFLIFQFLFFIPEELAERSIDHTDIPLEVDDGDRTLSRFQDVFRCKGRSQVDQPEAQDGLSQHQSTNEYWNIPEGKNGDS